MPYGGDRLVQRVEVRLVFSVIAILISLFNSRSALAITINLTDFDDSFVESRQSRQGTFETTYKLFRIEQRSNILQEEPTGPKVISVTPIEYHRFKDHFGKGNRNFGSLGMTINLKSGPPVKAGNYNLIDPDSFERFNSAPGKNFLLEDFLAAEARAPIGNFKGEFWAKAQIILSNPETASTFGILTARGHERKDWEELFDYLTTKKDPATKRPYFANLPNFNYFHNVSRPEYDRYAIEPNIPLRKLGVLREMAMLLVRVPVTEADMRLDPDGMTDGKYHYLNYTDDNQKTLDLVVAIFQEFARNKKIRAKFGVFNAGTESEVKESGRPRYTIIESEGTFRKATYREMVGEPSNLTEDEVKELLEEFEAPCASALNHGGGK